MAELPQRSDRPSSLADPMRITLPLLVCTFVFGLQAAELKPIVEVEDDVYSYTNANNGAGPMWCHGSTCLVRVGKRVFASGLETVPGEKPLNNCRWMLFERGATGWERVHLDTNGRTREPAPLVAFQNGSVFLSANPTLGHGDEPNGGPAQPELLEFKASNTSAAPKSLLPVWQGEPKFTEHSYRSFAADGPVGELILFQNIGYTHAEWTFRDRDGKWLSQGQLKWPWGADYDKPEPIRVCYPNVALRNRAAYFCGVSDVVEPYQAWRDFKFQLTSQKWDYDFRRLFFTWTPDISRKPFTEWVEIASCDKKAGWISVGDLYAADNHDVHLVWSERAIDERLRAQFFPEAKQRHSLNYALVHDGKVVLRRTIEESTESAPGIIGSSPRFQITPENRLFVVYAANGIGADGKGISEQRVREILPAGEFSSPARLQLQKIFGEYFTATVRGGSPPSRTLEMLGPRAGTPLTISYARIRLY
jgi:hypothetical protein